jgi:hypothetical protein
MATTTNYSWTTPNDTDLVKDGAAAIRSLGTAIDTTVFNNAGAAIAKTIVDAKGDLIVATAADTVARLASSASNGDLLTVDTTTATGLKWSAPAAAGGMTLIAETVASALSSLSYTSLGSYKQLLLVWSGIRHSATGSAFDIRLNNNSGSIYNNKNWGLEASNGVNQRITTTSITNYAGGNPFGTNATDADLSSDASGTLMIDNYTSATKNKTYFGTVSYYDVTNAVNRYTNYQGTFASTTAVTSLDIIRSSGSATFSNSTNTTIRLYGLS